MQTQFSQAIIPPAFRLAYYELTLEALDHLVLQPLQGGTLRGGFGLNLKYAACLQPGKCRGDRCLVRKHCLYGYVFETESSINGSIPRPYILRVNPVDMQEQLSDGASHVPVGETLTFGLTLIGQAVEQQAGITQAFEAMGQTGLGRTRGRYLLQQVEQISPYATELAYLTPYGSIPVIDHHSYSDASYVAALASHLRDDQITLKFLTPTQLTIPNRKDFYQLQPPFDILIRRLFSRMWSLAEHHCGQIPPIAESKEQQWAWLDLAKTVTIVDDETRYERWYRRSSRQEKEIYMDGLIGEITYRGELGPFLPLLLLGSVIHVGKNTVAGAGQYVIHPEPRHEVQGVIAPPSNTAKHAAPSPAPATFSADADLTEATLRSRAQSLAKLVHQDTSAFPASEADGLAAELRAVSRQVLTTIANAAAIQNLVEKRAKYQTARQTLAELMATLLLAQDLDYLPTDQTVTRSEHVDQLLSTVLDSLSY